MWIYGYLNKNEEVILTKDTDFYNRYLNSESGPKVIYFQLGNITLPALHEYFSKNWVPIKELIKECDFLIARKDSIETFKRKGK
ncbi:DUF5615 family PIN-like protein [Imperialibacter roseus]|jgi:predicted nuclease of predicted toxin-antitoxin system|uniref:DUF5615 family PIN-like protein n=1 Tax=Imperialibacter roseus TaxID=1324217 RepID=UPI00374F53CA